MGSWFSAAFTRRMGLNRIRASLVKRPDEFVSPRETNKSSKRKSPNDVK
jgi:hypothetical protein